MCGICGFTWEDAALVRQMTDALTHRGPDASGHHTGPGVSLGHRRLSIIDLSERGNNPMYNEEGDICVVFNGEIYNFKALKAQLEKLGHRFRSDNDSEVLVHGYEAWGDALLPKLAGMFAFALWDSRSRKLWLVRDRVGKKPLYYYQGPSGLLFASEIKALFVHPGVPRKVNLAALDRYLTYRYVPGPDTLFEGIVQVPPGHALTWEEGAARQQAYWTLSWKSRPVPEAAAAERIRALLDEAVKRRLMSDVPLGLYLSGGVDSSAIAALMRKYSDKVQTFALGFDEEEADESGQAREVAQLLGTEHREIRIEAGAAKSLPKVIYHLDNPLGDLAILANSALARLARKSVKVVLSGEGADELFAGYVQHKTLLRAQALERLVPGSVRRAILSPLVGAAPVRALDLFLHYPVSMGPEGRARLAAFLRQPADAPENYARTVGLFSEEDKDALYAPALRKALGGSPTLARLRTQWPARSAMPLLTRVLAHEFAQWLPDDILFKYDKITMMHSLEGRAPYLDHELVEYAAALPPSLALHGATEKYILRKALAPLLPKAVRERKKHAFVVPAGRWFAGDLPAIAAQLFDSAVVRRRGYFREPAIARLVAKQRAPTFFAEKQFVSLAILELWHRIFIDTEGGIAPELRLEKLLVG